MAILGHAFVDLSHHRREAIKPNLNKEFAALCSEQVSDVLLILEVWGRS